MDLDERIEVALAQPVTTLPVGEGWRYEPKVDGHRLIMVRGARGVRCQARSGRDTTAVWPDLAAAGDALPIGTILDGEAVIWRGGALDFAAAQARAASSPARAAILARRLPASYAVWDVLVDHGDDVRRRPYDERRARLLEVVGGLGPPIQPVPMTDDPDVALTWYDSLRPQGVEGIVCKKAHSTYRKGRIWRKLRHADTLDALVVGFTGSQTRPRALVVRLPTGDPPTVTQTLLPAVAAQVAQRIRHASTETLRITWDGVRYTPVRDGPTVEVQAGSTRHRVITVVRLR